MTMVLQGKLCVVTYLYLFAHAAYGMDRQAALEWAQELYRTMFPVSATRMVTQGDLLVKPATGNQRN
jgi:hypothetical protein